jgi:hypothetical protein
VVKAHLIRLGAFQQQPKKEVSMPGMRKRASKKAAKSKSKRKSDMKKKAPKKKKK